MRFDIMDRIWAKKSNVKIHLLINHMLDVYHTANCIIDKNIKVFSKLESFSADNQVLWSAIIGLHDIGKATPHFQNSNSGIRHESLSVYILFHYFQERLGIDKRELLSAPSFKAIKFIVMHHSKFEPLNKQMLIATHSPVQPIGDKIWKNIQFEIIDKYLSSINIIASDLQLISFKKISDAAYFSGLMTLADWVGSDANNFRLEDTNYTLNDYLPISKHRAESAIYAIGLNITPNIVEDTWRNLFPMIKKPRKLQEVSINCELFEDSNLIIIEAPTGEGKTEAAFNLTAKMSKHKEAGIYIAMPTQATSNGLFKRFEEFLKNADANPNLNLKLIHGGTFLNNLKNTIEQNNIIAPDIDTQLDAFKWFNQGKKAFLAPYGIGTIDQALYSILIVKHFFLRLYSLAGKTVIFDEVHAYDSYMNELLLHLIKWLKALKANVILLSATLPSETKSKLIKAWDNNINPVNNSDYPIVNVVNDGKLQSYSFEARFESTGNDKFKIQFCEFSEGNIAKLAYYHYNNGARVLVITNKVKRSQNIFNNIPISDKTLFHSRFTAKDREIIENKVIAKYGKGSTNEPSVLVSTQIVEQSLDIDFDIIISDLAPIDLLIQRAGRLHRHERERPAGYENPLFIIATHEAADGELPKINDGKIYAPIMLYRTYFALKENHSNWNFHRDFREPVEAVYYSIDENSETLLTTHLSSIAKDEIRNSLFKFNQETLSAENEAFKVKIEIPEKFDNILTYSKIAHSEEEENGRGLIAKTRLGSDTEKLILLFESNGRYFFDSEYNDEFETTHLNLDANTTYKLLINLISVYSYHAVKCSEMQPVWWDKIKELNPMLRHYRILPIGDNSTFKYDEIIGLTN